MSQVRLCGAVRGGAGRMDTPAWADAMADVGSLIKPSRLAMGSWLGGGAVYRAAALAFDTASGVF